MAKYIVFEEIDRRRGKAEELYLFEGQVHTVFVTTAGDVPILRRLTDEEVDALVTPKPADDERERFVRECAMRFMVGLTGDVDECVAEAMHAAESLAARLFGERTK